jgi:type I restriction enzyme M protein
LLDADTKRCINRARNVLVGKVPDPKSQIEQITIALIYRFMADLDNEAAQSNHQPVRGNGYRGFRWTELVQGGLDNAQKLEVYSSGLREMSENLGMPPALRKILGNARVASGDPDTLARFLRAIDEFQYDHLEQIGDTLEYLFAQLGSHRAGGQFCTPSHIREFMVSIVDPKRGETILDPACGTAGFLVSAHKHIFRVHDTSKDGISSYEQEGLRSQIRGYDISPEMVRLSLINLLVHGFNDPQIFEHDVLASEDYWNDYFDVIFANPPFMTPQGGIAPHAQFPIAARRSELLFLQYIATHLTEKGRAGIIVPEGMVFQNRGAYREVRKLLLDSALVAVVSLPAGCFNPYSEAKTSILFLDKALAKSSEMIGFFRAEHDGFGLGKLRHRIAQDDLPEIQTEINQFLLALRQGHSWDTVQFRHGQIVSKTEITADGEFNLTDLKYHRTQQATTTYPWVALGDVVEFLDFRRQPIRKADRKPGRYPYYGASGVVDHIDRYLLGEPLLLVGEDGAKWGPGERTAYCVSGKFWVNNHAHILRPRRDQVLDRYLEEVLNESDLTPYVVGVTVSKLNQERLKNIRIPLPSLPQQRKIVARIEKYQNAIEQARDSIIRFERKIRNARRRVLEATIVRKTCGTSI